MSEEEEICKLKKDIIRKIRDNEELENGLSSMDVKIGLLIKNRISLEEAELHLRRDFKMMRTIECTGRLLKASGCLVRPVCNRLHQFEILS